MPELQGGQLFAVADACKHSGAVLPLPSAPVGRGVDGIDAKA
jgi:nitrite reductase/ring-hydroxylating ferredoxin subunit